MPIKVMAAAIRLLAPTGSPALASLDAVVAGTTQVTSGTPGAVSCGVTDHDVQPVSFPRLRTGCACQT